MVNSMGSFFTTVGNTSVGDAAINTAIQAGAYAASALWLKEGSPVGAAIAKTSHVILQFIAQEGLHFVAKRILPESVTPVLLTVSPFIIWYLTITRSCGVVALHRRCHYSPNNFIVTSFYAVPLVWAINHFYARNYGWVCTSNSPSTSR